MKMFEGPANGIMLSQKEVSRTNISSMIDAIPLFLFLNWITKCEPDLKMCAKMFEVFPRVMRAFGVASALAMFLSLEACLVSVLYSQLTC
jgi:hypothetical protein